ncbi:hypothetical protein NQ176_g9367 [Zarea fungicola]|uniref:Uncharacterized protein n=1 Tax=Zarea fungicola TaxID=93591 RepID=A0ACC1MP58_9HYPO|nr:hypothetical protein NQ176_g9367 [Lecanicillium fungicola]
MGNGFGIPENDYDPARPEEYTEGVNIPFVPDGDSPILAGQVELVRGIAGRFRGSKCVRKTIMLDADAMGDEEKSHLVHEVKILHSARHHHVIKLVHTYFQPQAEQMRFCIVMDRADTNLEAYLKRKLPHNTDTPLHWFGCLVAAVRHIHDLGIRHRDIKPSNILVKAGQVLLTDFGISQMGLGKTMPTTDFARNAARTKEYCAPEVDQGRTRGRSADIFSLGAVFLEMYLAWYNPEERKKLNEMLRTSESRSYSKHIHKVSDMLRRILAELDKGTWQHVILRLSMAMLGPDRDQRPTIETLQSMEPLSCRCVQNAPISKSSELLSSCKDRAAFTVKHLLLEGADPNTMGALHLAAERGSWPVVQELLQAGATADGRNGTGQTALHGAARNGIENVVDLLLTSGADVNAKDENDQTALHGAAAHGYYSVVRMLLQAGADLTMEDLDGNTAHHFAGRRGHVMVVELLDHWKTDVN